MMDWTDRHCRVFHRVLAPKALLYTEMVHAQAVIHGDRDRLLGFDTVEHPVAVQLGGSEPAHLAQAARIAQDWGYDEVNLNVGCPSDRVQDGRFGAYVTDGTTNATLRKGDPLETLTKERAYEILAEKRAAAGEAIAVEDYTDAARAAAADESDAFVAENYPALKQAGLVEAGVPQDLGGGGQDVAALAARLGEAALPVPADIWLVRFDPVHVTTIADGENGGRSIRNVNVVRDFTLVGQWTGERTSLPLPRMPHSDSAYAVLVQERDAGPILGATRLAVPPR